MYLRGLENEDLSYFIHSVTFALHPSFAEPNRELFHAPYEVTETGWGEFVIGITIKFRAVSGLEPIVLQHTLKLFPLPHVQPSTKKPVRFPRRTHSRERTLRCAACASAPF